MLCGNGDVELGLEGAMDEPLALRAKRGDNFPAIAERGQTATKINLVYGLGEVEDECGLSRGWKEPILEVKAFRGSNLAGKRCTAYLAAKLHVVLAGATWVEPYPMDLCVTDGNLVTGAAWVGNPQFIAQFMAVLDSYLLSLEEIKEIETEMKSSGYLHNSAQKRLAKDLTRFVHGEAGLHCVPKSGKDRTTRNLRATGNVNAFGEASDQSIWRSRFQRRGDGDDVFGGQTWNEAGILQIWTEREAADLKWLSSVVQ
ncbi:hypothetical protein LXL04_007618 [Taraxacum kok-saghyz]